MYNLIFSKTDDKLQKVLYPMINILNKKNIIEGIKIVTDSDKLYICFDRMCLSKTNQLILEKISYIYSETFFYSDNNENPNLDRLKYWCPDDYYDKKYHITERCRNKKMIALGLDLNDKFTILGTSIMLANTLQEQDPLCLRTNQDKDIFEPEILKRHKHYISSGSPDLKWISLNIFLNKDNPLRDNSYAPIMNKCEINSPVSCDNIILSTLVGYNEKINLIFNMEKAELEKVINEYFNKSKSISRIGENIDINQISKKLLLKKDED